MANPFDPNVKWLEQVCVIPFRLPEQRPGAIEFCLITSLQKKRWIFPKGIIDPGETPEQTAAKEVWEEAGLVGRLRPDLLGYFDDYKWGCALHVQVRMMEVTESAEQWPESAERQRVWLTADEAARRLSGGHLAKFLVGAVQRLRGSE
jgi:8-oxo-dGTP pyrophosphatase MutT (NUDIX family)